MPSYYNKHGEFCLINYNESFGNIRRKVTIFSLHSQPDNNAKNNIINQTEIKGVCPIYQVKSRMEYTLKDSKENYQHLSR